MKKIIPILLTLILAISCDNTPKFHVEGTVEGATDSMLYLEAQTLEGIQPLDSVKLTASGSFTFAKQKKVENPEFYTLRISNRRINFSVDSTETITFNINVNTSGNEIKDAKIEDFISKLNEKTPTSASGGMNRSVWAKECYTAIPSSVALQESHF